MIYDTKTQMMDLSVLDSLKQEVGDDTLMILVQAFTDDIQDHRDLFSALMKEGDLSMLAIKSHAFKSASFSFGAMELGHCSKAIEMAITDEKTDTLSDLLEHFDAKALETIRLYTDFLGKD